MTTETIVPIILSGGIGSRLWPASRRSRPKQLLPLVSELSMIAATAERASGLSGSANPIVVTNEAHAQAIADDLRESNVAAKLIMEPIGRNTAPAVAAAALVAQQRGEDPLLLVLPSDHTIGDVDAFAAAVSHGAVVAASGSLVTFGITPERPETGYGYIRGGAAITSTAKSVASFQEKPDSATAEQYVASGNYYWNSGMFLFRASVFLEELARFEPEMYQAVVESVEQGTQSDQGILLDAEAFGAVDGDSIDYAVMERTDRAAVVPCDLGWNDVGSWASAWDISDKDEDGNVVSGDAVLVDVQNSLIRADSRLVAVVGVEDVVVVETSDSVLVISRDQAQRVKEIVDRLEEDDRVELDVAKEERS